VPPAGDVEHTLHQSRTAAAAAAVVAAVTWWMNVGSSWCHQASAVTLKNLVAAVGAAGERLLQYLHS